MSNSEDPKWVADGLAFWRAQEAKARGKAKAHAADQVSMFEFWARRISER